MVIVPEESSNNCFTFLESYIEIKNGSLSAHMYSKNYTSLLCCGTPKIVSSQNFSSFTGEARKLITRMGSILGRLAAGLTYSYPNEMFVKSFIHLLVHFLSLGYPPNIIKRACMKKYYTSKQPIWKLLYLLVKASQ
jgi:hypothetical protein